MVNTSDVLSIVTTIEAGPIESALKENKVERVVAIPAKINMIHALPSICFISGAVPWYNTKIQVMETMKSACIANARLESTFFKPAFVSTITNAAESAARIAQNIHIVYLFD